MWWGGVGWGGVGGVVFFFFFQAEDGIRDWSVTGVQTCALPICGNIAALLCPSSSIASSASVYNGVSISEMYKLYSSV